MYPVMLDVHGRNCLVVGGGPVALRKVKGLLDEGAMVSVVAQKPCDALATLAGEKVFTLYERAYEQGEACRGYALVFAATDDRKTNKIVYEDATRAGVWANVADDPELCSFHLPARVQWGPLQIALTSDGRAPFATRRMRKLFQRRMGKSWRPWAECAAIFRDKVRKNTSDVRKQNQLFDDFFSRTIDEEQLVAHALSSKEMDSMISVGKLPGRDSKSEGFVSLVGAGPGDPGLLTIRALQRLQDCDAVVYDRLALSALPGTLPDKVEMYPVGKRPHHHPVSQKEINRLLVRLAKQGKKVVRLKGGDPFVFGRGGEEAQELADAGVPFEVVAGVTAGIAASACAGIPVTHRRTSVRLTLVTGHESEKEDGAQVRWDLLAQDKNATLVGYMSMGNLPGITRTLMEAGMDPETPAALVHRGCTSTQVALTSNVGKLVKDAKDAGIVPPSIFIIGPTVGLSDRLDWFSKRPLAGNRMAIFHRESRLANLLDLAGAEVARISMPMSQSARVLLDSTPIDSVVFTSGWQVGAMDENGFADKFHDSVQALCMGRDTFDAAQDAGWKNVKNFSWDLEL